MSKKKRRYNRKKQNKKKNVSSSCCDRHHLFWTRRSYSQHPWALKLRNHPYCIVPIPKNTLHREIHHYIPKVPLPNEQTCQSTYEQLVMLEEHGALKDSDGIIKRLDLLIFVMKYAADDTVEVLEHQRVIASRYYKKDE